MNILTQLAQSSSYYNYSDTSYSSGTEASLAAAGFLFAFSFFVFILSIIFYVISALSLMQIFKKAGVKPWIAWVPFYNNWKLLELGGQQGFWAVLAIVPFVNIVAAIFLYIAMFHVGKKFGKDGAFVLLAIFLPFVWLIWLAVDKSKFNDEASTVRSIA